MVLMDKSNAPLTGINGKAPFFWEPQKSKKSGKAPASPPFCYVRFADYCAAAAL